MKKEYAVINKTELLKEIEELESKRGSDECSDPRDYSYLCGKIHQLEQVLLISTPFIPEIEKAFDAGQNGVEAIMKCEEFGDMDWYAAKKITQSKKDYISNLKLDI